MKKIMIFSPYAILALVVVVALVNQPSGTKKNFSHPEAFPGEEFVMNISDNFYDDINGMCFENLASLTRNFQNIGWRTKRLGRIAYDVNGKPLKGYRPVFAKKWEVDKERRRSR